MRPPSIVLLYLPAFAPTIAAAVLGLPSMPAQLAGLAVLVAGAVLQRVTGSWLLLRPAVTDSGSDDGGTAP